MKMTKYSSIDTLLNQIVMVCKLWEETIFLQFGSQIDFIKLQELFPSMTKNMIQHLIGNRNMEQP